MVSVGSDRRTAPMRRASVAKGAPRKRWALRRVRAALVLAMLAVAPGPVAAEDAEALRDLARAGAPGLALARLEALPPAADPLAREALRRLRVELLAKNGDWAGLVEWVDNAGIADPWFREQQLRALLRLHRPEAALARLRDWIWSGEGGLDRWRRWVVRAYLALDRPRDAYAALIRLRQDGALEKGDRELEARVLLAADRPAQALSVLADMDGPGVGLMRARARLAAGEAEAAAIAEQAASRAARDDLDAERRLGWWRLAAEAHARAGSARGEIRALERALALEAEHAWLRPRPGRDAPRLWRAYLDTGRALGNRINLLVGDDDRWFSEALAREESAGIEARSLYAFLAVNGQDARAREKGHEALARSLVKHLGGSLVAGLYADAERFPEAGAIPRPVRYRLVDQALEIGAIERAARLMESLPRPPAGEREHAFAWQLRRARVHILAGRFEAGSRMLAETLAGMEAFDPQRVDRLLQVCFDLQKVDRHDLALPHFRALLERPVEPRQHRELLYWTAESLQGTGQPAAAAEHFLRSATLPGPYTLDPWAQTALYQAAGALREAGLRADARRILERLLGVTRDPARRATLKHDIQQLRLAGGDG